MYKSFTIKNFKCFRELTITNLERVNLIAGMNNVGKSALLEALFIHCGAYNTELVMRVNAFRGVEMFQVGFASEAESPWDSFFMNFDISKEVELVGTDRENDQRIVKLKADIEPGKLLGISGPILDKAGVTYPASEAAKVLELTSEKGGKLEGNYYLIFDPKGMRMEPIPPPPPFPAVFLAARARIPLAEDVRRFTNLQTQKQHNVVLNALKVIEPRLHDLKVGVGISGPMIYGDIGREKLIPLPFLGEGMARLASLALAIANAPNGVVLVDEIENGLHYSILSKVWQVTGKVARQFDTQIFATTHSLECIAAAHKGLSKSDRYDFRFHRLERVDETIRIVTYDRETLEAAIETGLEVR